LLIGISNELVMLFKILFHCGSLSFLLDQVLNFGDDELPIVLEAIVQQCMTVRPVVAEG